MAGNSRSLEQVRLEIEAERDQLTGAVDSLRSDTGAKLRAKLPIIAAGALGVGFVFAGGIGAATDAGFGVCARLLPARGPTKASDKPNRAMMRAFMMLPI